MAFALSVRTGDSNFISIGSIIKIQPQAHTSLNTLKLSVLYSFITVRNSNVKRKIKIFCHCAAIVTFLAFAATAATGSGIYFGGYSCEDLNVANGVHPNDTVLMAKLDKECHRNAYTEPAKPIENSVELFATNCDNLQVYTTDWNHSYLPYKDVTAGVAIIDQSHKSGSNFYIKGTNATISMHLLSSNNADVYICVFKNSSNFDIFKYPNVNTELFFDNLKEAVKCDMLGNVSDVLHTFSISINDTGYYFAGVASVSMLTSVQYNISVSLRYYNKSDFLTDRVPCVPTTTCFINISYPNTCLMATATSGLGDTPQFNYLSTKAAEVPVASSSNFKVYLYVLIPFTVIFIAITVVIYFIIVKKVVCTW